MPRALNEQEKSEVLRRFFTLGKERFIEQGLRKTSLADLIEDAQIGKGTFYLFFESKEHLFWAIAQHEERLFRCHLRDELEALSCGREAVIALLRSPRHKLKEHPFLRLLLVPQTIANLSERIGLEELQQANEEDREYFLTLATTWKDRGWLRCEVNPQEVFDCLAALFVVALDQHLIGEAESDRATDAIAHALAARWT